jgi:transposase-like protein
MTVEPDATRVGACNDRKNKLELANKRRLPHRRRILYGWRGFHDPVFDIPPEHRRRLRTTNRLKRRTRVATLFPNEASLLRLASAVLAEIDQEWQSAKVYLTMETNR